MSGIVILAMVLCSCQIKSLVDYNDNVGADSVVFTLIKNNSMTHFVSISDTISFSETKYAVYKNDSSTFSTLDIDGQHFFIPFREGQFYSIQRKLELPSFVSYLDLPYDELSIDWGVYADPEILKIRARSEEYLHCNVVINKQQAKNQKNLTRRDWKKAKKRKKETINFLEIVGTESGIIYASASRTAKSNGEVQYSVKISDQCPDKSKILFKSALFMILWIYQNNQK